MIVSNQVADADVKYLVEVTAQSVPARYSCPSGYKQTEVGMIPEDWEPLSLYSIVSALEAGVSVNSVDKPNAFPHGKHVLKTSCVENGYFYADEYKSILPSDLKRAKATPIAGSIIVSRMNTPELVGELGYVEQDCPDAYLPDRLWQMKFRKDVELNTRWLGYILSIPSIARKIKDAASGTSNSMKNISKESLLSLTVPAPKPKEQTAIANALSDVDALINELEKLIAKKQAIKTATMQQLLTGRTRLPQFALREDGSPKGYMQSELGEIPEDWEVKRIGDFTDCSAGGTPSTSISLYWGGENPWMSSGELHLKRVYDVAERITDEGLANSSTKYVPANSVLMGLAGQGKTRGTVAIAKISLCTNQSIAAIFPSDQHSTDYLYYNLDQRYEELRGLSTGDGGRGGLNLTIIRNLFMAFPSIGEQTAIATILTDMDAEIQTLQKRLVKTRQIKQGMMQELLTGKTRLVKPAQKEVRECLS